MHSTPAFVDVPLRLWRSMSSIPRIHKANIAKDSDGQRAYCRTEVIKVPILTYFLGGADLGVPNPFRMSCAGRRLQGRLWRGTRIFRLRAFRAYGHRLPVDLVRHPQVLLHPGPRQLLVAIEYGLVD